MDPKSPKRKRKGQGPDAQAHDEGRHLRRRAPSRQRRNELKSGGAVSLQVNAEPKNHAMPRQDVAVVIATTDLTRKSRGMT